MSDWRSQDRFTSCRACGVNTLRAERTSDGRRILKNAVRNGAKIESTGVTHECQAPGPVHNCEFCHLPVRLTHVSTGYRLLDGTTGSEPHKGKCSGPKGTGNKAPKYQGENKGENGEKGQGQGQGDGQGQDGQQMELTGADGQDEQGQGQDGAEGQGQGQGQQPQLDGVELIAAVLAPKLDKMLQAKADKNEVKKLVEDAVLEALAGQEKPRSITITVKDRESGETKDLGLSHIQLPQLIRAIERHKHVYVHGAPGGGKGFAVRQAAAALSRPVAYLSLSPATPEWRLTGYLDAHGVYRSTTWRKAVEEGAIFSLDEVDNASAPALVALNETLANGFAAFPDGEIRVADMFACVAIGNTLGRGGVRGHETRQALDMATLDRFALIEWKYDSALETELVRPALGDSSPALIGWATETRATWRKVAPAEICPLTPRMLVRLAAALADGDTWPVAMAEAGGARFGDVASKLPAPPTILKKIIKAAKDKPEAFPMAKAAQQTDGGKQ